ncbi:unnamed protein product [Heligmosomoides polygyrus]|uniref:C-type lectin domain-containing protein n=1 Tax=Heligmosomoides polygyrus TaxID=6339 RepID=A0A183FFU6_HELPZ|nr:unnamed protein product [Heligmosomoides polygyrus]
MSDNRTAILELHRRGKRQCDIVNLLGRLSPQELVDDPHATNSKRPQATNRDRTMSVAEKETSSKFRNSAAARGTTTALKRQSTKTRLSRATDSATVPTDSGREKGMTVTRKATASVTEHITHSAAEEVPSEFATWRDVTTAEKKVESNAAARTGTPKAAKVSTESARDESRTTMGKSEESIDPATTEGFSATAVRAETGELKATAAFTDRKPSNEGKTTARNLGTPAAAQHNSTEADATVKSADSKATAHPKPSTLQGPESFSAEVSALYSDLMNSGAITKEGPHSAPSRRTTAHVATEPEGEGHSSAGVTASNHDHGPPEQTDSATGVMSTYLTFENFISRWKPLEPVAEPHATDSKRSEATEVDRTKSAAEKQPSSKFRTSASATTMTITTTTTVRKQSTKARTGTHQAAKLPSQSSRKESGTTIGKSEESIGPATRVGSSATEVRAETGELRATATFTESKPSNEGKTTVRNADTRTPAAAQHNSTKADATVKSTDSNATAHPKLSTPQQSESFPGGVSAASSDLMNSGAITKEGPYSAPSGKTTAHVATEADGEGRSSAGVTGSNHENNFSAQTEPAKGIESFSVPDEKSSTSMHNSTGTAAGYHNSTGSTQKSLHTQSNITDQPNSGKYSEETTTASDLLMQNETEAFLSQGAYTSFVTQDVSLTEVSFDQENSTDPTLEIDSTQAYCCSGETLFADGSTTLQTEIDGANGTAAFNASTAISGQMLESATDSSSGQDITGVTEESDDNGQRNTTEGLDIQETASTRLDYKWSQSRPEGGALNSSEANQMHDEFATASGDAGSINNTAGNVTQTYQPGDDTTTIIGSEGMETNVTSNTTEDVFSTTTQGQGLEVDSTGESSTQTSVNTSSAHEDAAESDDQIKVNTSNSLSPLPNATELSGSQPVGTRIIHMCAVSYVFASTQQPLKVYECMAGGNWTSNFNGEACEYVAPRLKNMHDL